MRFYTLIALAAVGMFTLGCEYLGKDSSKDGTTSGDAHGHGHDHDHGDDHAHDHPAHGPNAGHIFLLESESIQGEWKEYKGNDEIRIFLLTKDEKPSAAPVKAANLKIIPLAGNDATPFVLAAEDADADGMASTFMLEEAKLRVAIPLGVKIEIVTPDETITGNIDAHQPHGH